MEHMFVWEPTSTTLPVTRTKSLSRIPRAEPSRANTAQRPPGSLRYSPGPGSSLLRARFGTKLGAKFIAATRVRSAKAETTSPNP